MKLFGSTIRVLPSLKAAAAAPTLPIDLVVPANLYSYQGHTYDLTSPGLYRFVAPEADNQQRLVVGGDIYDLMSAISWISIHGNTDDNLAVEDVLRAASSRSVALTCGPTSILARTLATQFGYKARLVVMMASEPLNTYDNGHTMVEVYTDTGWVVFDVDGNEYFVDATDGSPLSLIAFMQHLKLGTYFGVPLAADPYQAPFNFSSKNFSWAFYDTYTYINRHEWLSRMSSTPMIEDPTQSGYYLYPEHQETLYLSEYSPFYSPVSSIEFYRIYNNH